MKVRPPSMSWVAAVGQARSANGPAPAHKKTGSDRLELGDFEQMVRRLVAEQPPGEQVDPNRLEAARLKLQSGELDRSLDEVAEAILEDSRWLEQLLD